MKYAIISDIHGNHPALIAALADVEKQKVDKTLFLGDYYMGLPWGNEVGATPLTGSWLLFRMIPESF